MFKTFSKLARILRSFVRYENERGNFPAAYKMIDEAKDIFARLDMPIELERTRF